MDAPSRDREPACSFVIFAMAAIPTTQSSKAPRGSAYWIPVLTTLVLVLIAAKRIRTYVTAQDPYWYIGLAHEILGGPSNPAEFAHGLSYISPGFPLVLAGLIKAFGIYAPYLLNPLLAVGFFLLYAELIRHLFPSPFSVRIFLPGTLLLLFAGYTLNVHFLLYPFRGMPVYFLALLGMYLLCVPGSRKVFPATVLAGCAFTLAVTIREPAIFVMAGAGTWILQDGGIRSPRAWKRLGAFLSPLAVGGLILVIIVLAQGRTLNNQFESWLTIVSGRDSTRVLGTAGTMARYLLDSFHLTGFVLAGVGVWSCRRNCAVLCLFVLPAIALFFFYALYMPHYRYVLTVVVFISPVICAGALKIVEAIHRRVPRLRAPWVLAICLIATGAITVRSMEPWGRKVNRQQVETLRQDLARFAPDDSVAFVDPSCRYLVDALVCYSGLALRNPAQVRAELKAGRRCFHFKPLDEMAYYEGYLDGTLDPLGLPPAQALPFYARVEPVRGSDGTTRVITLANGHFAVEEVLPWNRHRIRQPVRLSGREGHTLWLDFGEHPPGTRADIQLEDSDGQVMTTWTQVPARHIQGLYAAVADTGRGSRVVDVRCSAPLPDSILRQVVHEGQSMKLFLGAQRSPSIHYWLHPPFAPPRYADAKVGRLAPAGRLVFPVPLRTEHLTVDYLIGLETSPGLPQQQLHIGGPHGSDAAWPVNTGLSYALVSLSPPHRQQAIGADLALSSETGRPSSRIASISIAVRAEPQSE